MTARLMFVAAATLSMAVAASAADPAKPDLRDSDAPTAPRDLLLASADLKAPDAAAQVAAPARHRTARVTTCRCGDPQPQSDSAETADSE
jgi:hypothetical protein